MWKRLHLISVTEPCGPECLPRLECDCVACFFSSWLHFRKSERKVKGREIFTRWNAKAWPTMIAMEGSIVKFFFYFFSGVCWFATRWAVASTRWFSACWSCTARWWRFNMWWQPGGAWGGGGGSVGAEGCLYATRALIYWQAPETNNVDFCFVFILDIFVLKYMDESAQRLNITRQYVVWTLVVW